MHFALETDYAVRLVAVLADSVQSGVESMDAASLGEAACIPKPTALKVLRRLKDRGIIQSTLGASGGYRLARNPSEITLIQVIEALEGTLEISRCISDCYECSRTGTEHDCCKFHRLFETLNKSLRAELGKINFEGKNL